MNEHYKKHTIEAIDVIRDWNLGFELGNVIKYIARHNHKGTPLKDLAKAEWYLREYMLTLSERIAKLDKMVEQNQLDGLYDNTITGTTHLKDKLCQIYIM